MDSQVQWFRDRVLRSAIRRVVFAFALVTGVFAAVLVGALGVPTFPGVGWALVAGLVITTGWFITGLFTNPVDFRYLLAYVGESVEFGAQKALAVPDVSGSTRLCFTLVDDTAEGRPVFDVFAAGPTVVCRGRSSGSVSFLARLADGRIMCTDRQLSIPHEDLVLNIVTSDDAAVRLRSHQALLERLAARGLGADPNPDPNIVLDYLARERDGYRAIGPLLGSLLNVDGGSAPLRLLIGIRPDELLELALGAGTRTEADTAVRRLHVETAMA